MGISGAPAAGNAVLNNFTTPQIFHYGEHIKSVCVKERRHIIRLCQKLVSNDVGAEWEPTLASSYVR